MRAMIVQQDKQADLERFTADAKWFDSHYDELMAKYPDHWVGVYHKKVVGASTNGEDLIVKLSNDGMPVGRIYFNFLDSKQTIWAFVSN